MLKIRLKQLIFYAEPCQTMTVGAAPLAQVTRPLTPILASSPNT